jgi:RimJ/RimL family protein N-acetyltransferase
MELHTERLILRPWRTEDRAPFASMNAEADVVRYLNPMTADQSDAMLGRIDAHFAEHGFGFWALEHRGSAALIGMCGLSRISWQASFTPAVEIGWRLLTSRQGQGYAKEAALRSLAFAFEDLKLDRVVSFTVPANRASWGLMERLGMVRIGEFRHPNLPTEHRLSEHVLYELKAENAKWR